MTRRFLVFSILALAALFGSTWSVLAEVESAPTSLDLSLRTHDDWPLEGILKSPSLDLSLRVHDDWPL